MIGGSGNAQNDAIHAEMVIELNEQVDELKADIDKRNRVIA